MRASASFFGRWTLSDMRINIAKVLLTAFPLQEIQRGPTLLPSVGKYHQVKALISLPLFPTFPVLVKYLKIV